MFYLHFLLENKFNILEFIKLSGHLKLDSLLTKFLIDYALYKGRYDDALLRFQQVGDSCQVLSKNIQTAGMLYIKKNFTVWAYIIYILEHICNCFLLALL